MTGCGKKCNFCVQVWSPRSDEAPCRRDFFPSWPNARSIAAALAGGCESQFRDTHLESVQLGSREHDPASNLTLATIERNSDIYFRKICSLDFQAWLGWN